MSESPMADTADAERSRVDATRPTARSGGFVLDNRAALGTLAVFVVMMAIFIVANPRVFTDWTLYSSVLTTLPVALFVVVPLVFVVTVGEIDLSFPGDDGLRRLDVRAGRAGRLRSVPRHRRGDRDRHGARLRRRLARRLCRPVVADRHARHELHAARPHPDHHRGQVDRAGDAQRRRWAYKIFSSPVFGIPVQIFWAIAFVVFSAFLYNRHRFGAQVKIVGDNPDSAQQMGIDVKRVRVKTFVFCRHRRGARRHLLDDDQLHLVADRRRRLSAAGAGLGLRRRHADLGRHRHRRRRRDRRAHRLLHPDRRRRRRARAASTSSSSTA